jgi:norsolorinic acid ketoreductase
MGHADKAVCFSLFVNLIATLLNLSSINQAMETLRTKHNITSLDLVLANAAIHPTFATFATIDPAHLDQLYETNIRGPIILFQAVLPLLDEKKSKFIVLSSGAGTIGQEHKSSGGGGYGQSKVSCP